MTAEQAGILSQWAKGPNARLEQLLTQDLGSLVQNTNRGGNTRGPGAPTGSTPSGGRGGGRDGGRDGGGGRNGNGNNGNGNNGDFGTSGGSGGGGSGRNSNGRATRITPSISSTGWDGAAPQFELASMQSSSRGSSDAGVPQQSGRSSSGSAGGSSSRVQKLDVLQLRRIFQEGIISQGNAKPVGRLNLNTVAPSVLRAMLPDDPISADAIVSARAASSTGLLAISDLLESTRISPQSLSAIAPYVDTQSYVFTITSRGRSNSTGLEVEITVLVDRSELPARILEYREQ